MSCASGTADPGPSGGCTACSSRGRSSPGCGRARRSTTLVEVRTVLLTSPEGILGHGRRTETQEDAPAARACDQRREGYEQGTDHHPEGRAGSLRLQTRG